VPWAVIESVAPVVILLAIVALIGANSHRTNRTKRTKPPAFRCPFCGFVSYNPNDLRERYCVRCHRFVDDG
jgi:hypothetical protein